MLQDTHPAEVSHVDTEALARELASRIKGEVRFDAGSRALYATDGSNYRQPPLGVVIPRDAQDVIQAVAIARQHGAPILSRGTGTSLAGQCCNTAVILDMSKYMNEIIELNPEEGWARVQPGVILDSLREEARQHKLTFAPDPATHTHNTLGGMIGNNSCGIHSVMGGRTADNIIELDVLTYDGERMSVGETSEEELERIIAEGGRRGEIYRRMKEIRDAHAEEIRKRYPDIPRRVSGYNLDDLLPEKGFHIGRALVGSESTLVVVLEAKVRLIYSPPERVTVVLGYEDIYRAGDHIPEVMKHDPVGCEGIDEGLIEDMKSKGLHAEDIQYLPEGKGWLLVELGAETIEEAERHAYKMMAALEATKNAPSTKLYEPDMAAKVWEIREAGLAATAHVPNNPDTWPGWEDSAVPPDRVGEYLRELRKLFNKYGYACDLYGHFGQGCIHTRIDFILDTAEGIRQYRAFVEEAADLVSRFGGSYSGEHGDGQARGELLPKMYGEELVNVMREFKAIWDPDWKMNPGKVIDPYKLDDNLRLGANYNPPEPETWFSFPEDDGSFNKATLRCVGVGKCRVLGGQTMCPSFMATREEKYTTRGRARLLFEMQQGEVLTDGWQSEAVKDALHLCLACKGCKSDCPVNVDMATYKAEFLAHYYEKKKRPINAYAFGMIDQWSRIASRFPGLTNFVTHTPPLSGALKRFIDMPLEREVPKYAPETFKGWFRKRGGSKAGARGRVILWPDTFNNFFLPGTARSAVEVLEAAGYQVEVPEAHVCCGRPLYDFGMLDRAKRLLVHAMGLLEKPIQEGVPVIGLEPSCTAVFRDELLNLFPHDPQAKRLGKQTYTLGEFLAAKADGFQPPQLARRALVHGHCNHKAIMGMDGEQKILDALGLDYQVLQSGCCGQAGSFGYEAGEKYEVSVKAGERVLAPAVRDATDDTLIIADGFSCREQIKHLTRRRALHLSEVLAMAMRGAPPE